MRNFRGEGLRNFFCGGGIAKFSGSLRNFRGGGVEKFSGGLRNIRGRGLSREGLNFFGRGDIFSGGVGNFLGSGLRFFG